jgi:hypothetical protein
MGNRMGHQNQDAQVLHCLRSQQPLFQRLEPDKSGTANMWRSKGSIARGLAPYIPALKDGVLRRVGITVPAWGQTHEETLCGAEHQLGEPISPMLAKHRQREWEKCGHKGYAYRYWIGART